MSIERCNQPLGFSRSDALVILAVLAVLIPASVLAIQRARLSREEVRCSNYLARLASAAHNHHDDYNILPTGGGNAEQGRAFLRDEKPVRNPPLGGKLPANTQPAPAPLQEWGWAFQILPYLELEDTWRTQADDDVRQTVIPEYFCPVRRKPSRNEKNAHGLSLAGIDYAGNGGVTNQVRWFGIYAPSYGDWTSSGVIIRISAWYPQEMPQPARIISFEGSIPDGTANTILFTEKRMQLGKVNKNPPNDDWSFVDGWSSDTIVRYHPDEEKLKPLQDNNDPVPDFAMGSAHPQGFLAAFCDKSVRKIRYTASPKALTAVLVRDDELKFDWRDLE